MNLQIFFVALFWMIWSSLVAPEIGMAHTILRPEEVELARLLGNSFSQSLDVSVEQNRKYRAILQARLNTGSGRFEDVKLFLPSGNAQVDLDLLDAVLSMDKVSVPSILRGNDFIDFEFMIGGSASGEISEIAKRYHREFVPQAGSSAFHAIPLSVLQKYPTLFTYLELTSPAHFRSIANKKIRTEEIAKLREPWLRFFDSHPSASKQQILELEKELDLRFALLKH
ncbi:MAG: hypothetical protein LCH63_14970 [Candidatus Melainabacteria bacterium]|nr:hypothetical protein [Candidatus Melainabacteria bacterium]